jgi:rhodanese-related sulfurtransferase
MNFSSSLSQIYIYLSVSILIGIVFNASRLETLPLIAKPMAKVENIDQISNNMLDPMIREIDLEIAEKLFEKKTLFVDARLKEYYLEGHIPNSLCNDNLDSLVTNIDQHISVDDAFVVYCSDDDCGSSEELAFSLQEQGFSNIYLFKGGWKQWKNNNLPFENNE